MGSGNDGDMNRLTQRCCYVNSEVLQSAATLPPTQDKAPNNYNWQYFLYFGRGYKVVPY